MSLVRGQRAQFFEKVGAAFRVSADIKGVDRTAWKLLCLLVGEQDRVINGTEVLFDPSQRSQCGSVVPKIQDGNSLEFLIDLTRTPEGVKRLVFVVVLLPLPRGRAFANQITSGSIQMKSPGNATYEYSFTGSDFGQETAVVLLELYRKDPWRVMAVGSGFLGGLAALLSRYNISNDLIGAIERGEAPLAMVSEAPTLPSAWPGGVSPKVPTGLIAAVGLVLVQDSEGNSGSGTAFSVGPGGLLLTCSHVIEGAVSIGIVMEGTTTIRPAGVVMVDADLDVALLALHDRNGLEKWFHLNQGETVIEIGQEVGILGYPLGGALGVSVTYSHGIINSLRRRPGGHAQVLQVDAGAAPGSSGAPVFDRASGRVLGILSSGLDSAKAGMLINFAVDLRNVLRLGWFSH